MQQTKVNTFIIGAQKAGTTSLYDWLGQHPDIAAPEEIKDYHFFCNDNNFKKGYEYLESFYRYKSSVRLHAAVNYMFFDELCAKRLYEYNPDAKIIICLRNPIKRAISAYKYFVLTLREDNSFSEAIRKEQNGELSTYVEQSNNTYIEHGKYYKQIETYLKYFPKEQLKIVFFEELISKEKQKSVIKDILSFLEIDSEFKLSFVHLNASSYPRSKRLNYIIRKSKIAKKIKSYIPFRIRRKIGKKIKQGNVSQKKLDIVIDKGEIEVLKKEFKEYNQKLKTIVNSKIIDGWL